MLDSVPAAALVGTVLGFLSGLGIGGGSLLILWLTLVLEMDLGAAREINLLFFLPSAGVACLFRKKQGTLNWKKVFPAVLAGCAAAAAGHWLGGVLDIRALKKAFGVLLIITGIRELLYKPKKQAS